ncbi:hypothetical protein LY90DRAFT_666514 [Neocallimastix californiae]|uniref:Rho-GAP domain-containing protein n=1 Tax=Neocallimastix californiae TaxID=1754190 RepID=A0A1Y2EQD2_9FUNG|nr:hypothetical protein LY90DRAFT_666514 [Neocallimastix californiae]|eukprot:ORY73759.1 hypothetical protein LY90DRAFT_666514 [Neocallimastix californiae]
MDNKDEISLLINNFPYPPTSFPKICNHEKCIDNPIHEPDLFENTISDYFSKISNELNEKDITRKEININSMKSAIAHTPYSAYTSSTSLSPYSFTPVYEIKSFNRENLILSKISCNNPPNILISNSKDITNNIPEKMNDTENNKLENRNSIISINNDITKNEIPNIVYPLNKVNLYRSNPSIIDLNKSHRLSLGKIKFSKSKSLNNIKGHSFYDKNEQETSFIRELSNDFKKMLTNYGILKEEINFRSNSTCGSINNINLNNTLQKENSRISFNKFKGDKKQNTGSKKEKSKRNSSNIKKEKSSLNNINEAVHSENFHNNKLTNGEIDIENKQDISFKLQNDLNSEKKILIVNSDNKITDRDSSNNEKDEINKNIEFFDELKEKSNISSFKLDESQIEKDIDSSQKSILTNKNTSITYLAPIASISLDQKQSPIDDLETPTELKQEILNKKIDDNKEYIKQISTHRLEKYRLNNGFVKDRIKKFKSNDEILNKPIEFNNNNNNNNSNSNIELRKKSLKSLEDFKNNTEIPVSSTQSSIYDKLKNSDNNGDLSIFEKFSSNDDIIKEKITVLNMTGHFKIDSSQSSYSRIEDGINKENDLIDNMENLRQGILGILPMDKKEKLYKFLINLDNDSINMYQQQLHDEYYQQKQKQLNNAEIKYVKINKYNLDFGCSKKKIPIEEEVTDIIFIESKGQNIKYSFEYINKDQMLDLNISSNSGILPNLVPQKIIFTLNCKATINRSIVIPLLIDDIYHFIILRVKSQNSCFGVNIKNCQMEVDSIFKSNQYNIPKVLKIYRELLNKANAFSKGLYVFESQPNINEIKNIKKQIVNNEPVTSKDISSIGYLFKNWFNELPRKLLYQINQEEILENPNFDMIFDKITGLERVVFSWLIDYFIEIQKSLPNEQEIYNIVKLFVPSLYNVESDNNTNKYDTIINNIELFINNSIMKRKQKL